MSIAVLKLKTDKAADYWSSYSRTFTLLSSQSLRNSL